MKPYTVLLLYPDYLADNYGEDTYQAWVDAQSVTEAASKAQLEAAGDDNVPVGHTVDDLNDFKVLAVYEGHHVDLSTELP